MAEGRSREQAAGAAQEALSSLRASSDAVPNVFISYASKDAATAHVVVATLERAGLRCWISPRDVVPGALYADEIVGAINDAKVFVLVLSEQAVASAHVGKEIERASSKRRRIVALRIDSAALTRAFEYFLSESQWIDARSAGVGGSAAKLVDAVHRYLAAEPDFDSSRANERDNFKRNPEAARRRRLAVVLTAAVAVVLGSFIVWKFWPSNRSATEYPSAATTNAVAPTATAISDKSVAVLPFVDMSEGKDQEYFSDGLSEELIELLGMTQGLQVTARTSSFYFKGKAAKLETIAAELRVANVLEGSVRKSGNRLRVTAQLIRVNTGQHLWSETFDRDLHDVFKVQDEIASAVVTALRVHLLPGAQLAANNEPRTENIDAYNEYLQGRQSYNQGDMVGYRRAITAFHAATTLDSRYAMAYAALALAQFWLADRTGDVPGYEKALAAAENAVALAPRLAAGYSARGFVRAVYGFDFAAAKEDLDKALALNPGDSGVLHRSAVLLAVRGELPKAIATEERALELDPLSEEICARLAFFLVANQQLGQARPLYEKALAIAPNSAHAHFNLGELELLDHRPEQALIEYRQTESGDFALAGQAKAEYSLGHVDASRRALNQLISTYGKISPMPVARVYAWRGETDKAFEWAERAYAQRDTGITWIKIDTDFRSLRGDARYKSLLRKMNLPQ